MSEIDRVTADEKIIQNAAFQAIFNGKPLKADEVALLTGLNPLMIQESVAGLLSRGLIVLDNSGTIVGSHGLSLIPTQHHLHINGRDLFTWCALDAIGIPAALGVEAKIESACHQCSTSIHIEVAAGKTNHSNQSDIRIWIVTGELEQSLVGSTWPQINFFCSVEHFDDWDKAQQRGTLLSLDRAAELGKQLWRDVLPIQ